MLELLKKRLATLSPERRASFLRALQERGNLNAPTSIRPRPPQTPLPLSWSQQRLWLLSKIFGETSAYNIPTIIDYGEKLDPHLVQMAINRIIVRHESLRTNIHMVDSQPTQAIMPKLHLGLQIHDFGHLPDLEGWRHSRQLIASMVAQPFDIANGPLLSSTFLRLEKRDILLIVQHHMITDGRSIALLQFELKEIVTALKAGRDACLPPLPIQYGDFVLWQKNRITSVEVSRQISYWHEQLAGMITVELPTCGPRPPIQTFQGAKLGFVLPQYLSRQVATLAQSKQTTPFVILLSAFYVLLSRYCGQDDIAVGVPVEGRTHPQIEPLIGLFINLLVIRADLSGEPSFSELVNQINGTVQTALSMQDVPFEYLVEELQPPRDLSRNPLVQIVFQLQARAYLEFNALKEEVESDRSTAKMDLSFDLFQTVDSIHGRIEFNTSLFEKCFIERMADQYRRLLSLIVNKPDAVISSYSLLVPDEIEALACRNTSQEIEARVEQNTVLDLFAESVQRTPEKTAVIYAGKSISYRELDELSDRIATGLRANGLQKCGIAVIALERSIYLEAGILAILKCGAAYLPIDLLHTPIERLETITAEARPAVFLANESCLVSLSSLRIPILAVEALALMIADAILIQHPEPDDLAYVIYTSGSTGRPKGVRIEHRSLANCLISIAQSVGIGSNDRLFAVTTISFDIATLELLLPVLFGATVIIAETLVANDASALSACLEEFDVTIMQATPATWKLLVSSGWQGRQSITILCGGEALPWSLARVLLPRCRSLWNLYGPTETTIWALAHRVAEQDGKTILSSPLANYEVRILDRNLQPVPLGVKGELCISGPGVGRGYVQHPEGDAQRFLDDPFSPRPGARMYRTGDVARFLEPGFIECLGRTDDQVKLRGYRIELGEVEAVIRSAAGISDCVVLKIGSSEEQQRLVAYLLSQARHDIDTTMLRTFLQSRLPDYMCPAQFVIVESFPLTGAGKIDRKALCLMKPHSYSHNGVRSRGSSLEERIARIWEGLLGSDNIAFDDSFFDIGGNSLLLVRLAAALKDEFSLEVPILELMRHPTINKFASYLPHAAGGDSQ